MRKSQPHLGVRLGRAALTGTAVAVLVVAGTAAPAFAASVALTMTPTTGPVGTSTSITVTGTGFLTGISSPTARFVANSGSCPSTLGTASATNVAATIAGIDNNSATITAPVVPLGNHRVCVYASSVSTAAIAGTSTVNFLVTAAAPVLSPSTGPLAGGNAVTVTGPSGAAYLTSATTVGAVFNTATCPNSYTTTGTNFVATAAKTSTSVATVTAPGTLSVGSAYNVCVYNGTTAVTSLLLGQSSTKYGVLPPITLSPTVGPSAGGNTITATATTAVLSGITSPGVTLSRAACPSTYTTTGDNFAATTVTKISNSKVAAAIPSTVVLGSGETTAAYNVCIYRGTGGSSTLVTASSVYTIAPLLTLSGISPSGGPAQGGSSVTITGTGFPFPADEDTVVTVSIGGSPLTDVEVESSSSITGTTTAHAAGVSAVSVTTAGGTKTLASAFTFSYGISISPNTATTSSTTYLDILGVGFSGLTFGTGAAITGARVFLVNDTYLSAGSSGTWTTAPVAECTGVLPISDNEIICSLNTGTSLSNAGLSSGGPVPNGTYTVSVVSNAVPGATLTASDVSIISSGSTFTVAPY